MPFATPSFWTVSVILWEYFLTSSLAFPIAIPHPTVDNISINLDKYEVKLDGELITDLKPKEVQLLYFFLTNKNQVFSREQLLDKVWGYEYYGGTRTVDVHIKSVREKLSSPNNKWEIKTIWNVGYKFEVK